MNNRSKRPSSILLLTTLLVLASLSLGITHPVARAGSDEAPLTSERIAAAVVLPVPNYLNYYGSAALAAGMIAAYYDRTGYPNIYTGPTNGGVMPLDDSTWGTWSDGISTWHQNPLTASRNGLDGRETPGTVDDYWVAEGSAMQDPFIGYWLEHSYGDAIGDYMHTGQSSYGLADGVSRFDVYSNANALTCDTIVGWGGVVADASVGRRDFYAARGYTVTDCYNQRTDNLYPGGFSYAQYKAEIDAGKPVLLNLASGADRLSLVGIGYDNATNTIWMYGGGSPVILTMTWGGTYLTVWTLDSVSIVTPAYPLNVSKDGTGSGTVSSAPSGIDCGSDCTGDYLFGTVVKLTAAASPGSLFTGWSGAGCSGLKFCWVTMNAAKSVTASFTTIPPGTYPVTVVKGGTGSGTATSTPAGISCGTDCWEFYTAGTVVKLTPAASAGSTFIGWSGACGSMDYCWLGMGASKYVTANFALTPPGTYPLIVAMKGNGTGKVSSTPAGISCWPDCYEFYAPATLIKLTADPAIGSDFIGWSGACGGTANCWVTMSQSRWVTANWAVEGAAISPLDADLSLFRDPSTFFTFMTRPMETLLPAVP